MENVIPIVLKKGFQFFVIFVLFEFFIGYVMFWFHFNTEQSIQLMLYMLVTLALTVIYLIPFLNIYLWFFHKIFYHWILDDNFDLLWNDHFLYGFHISLFMLYSFFSYLLLLLLIIKIKNSFTGNKKGS